MFCQKCKTLLFPQDGKLVCRKCGTVHEPEPKNQVIKHKSRDKEMAVLGELSGTLPTADAAGHGSRVHPARAPAPRREPLRSTVRRPRRAD